MFTNSIAFMTSLLKENLRPCKHLFQLRKKMVMDEVKSGE